MKKGDLYKLKKRDGVISALFPYFTGGEALILSVKKEVMIVPMKGSRDIDVVEFLFDGKIYIETIDTFSEHATYIGGNNV